MVRRKIEDVRGGLGLLQGDGIHTNQKAHLGNSFRFIDKSMTRWRGSTFHATMPVIERPDPIDGRIYLQGHAK